MTDQNNYFEIGRGSKLIPMEYWHQYVLGIDLTEVSKYLVVSEVGRDKILYTERITLEEIQNSKWNELLEFSNTKTFVKQLTELQSGKNEIENTLTKILTKINETTNLLNGNWISIEEYNNLDYNSNFGNWVDAFAIGGKLKFLLDLNSSDEKNCHIGIPVHYYSMGDGYFSIQMGRFELTKTHILIWQNDIYPSQIEYEYYENELTLNLYQNKIKFVKE